ncbi:MAG TPA: hypothetical protein VF516_30560, partial [Kofleriaceae bacterium]
RNTGTPVSTGTGAPVGTGTGAPVGTGSSSVPVPPPLPAGRQCLPAMICNDWAGCALVENSKVVSADRLVAGEPVSIGNGCTTGATCIAARAVPKGVTCPVDTIPPRIDPPLYTCAWDGTACVKR